MLRQHALSKPSELRGASIELRRLAFYSSVSYLGQPLNYLGTPLNYEGGKTENIDSDG